jgi:hypothetical protein
VGTTRRRRVQLNNGLLDNQEARNQHNQQDMNLENIIVMEAIRVSLMNSNNNNNTTITASNDNNNS